MVNAVIITLAVGGIFILIAMAPFIASFVGVLFGVLTF